MSFARPLPAVVQPSNKELRPSLAIEIVVLRAHLEHDSDATLRDCARAVPALRGRKVTFSASDSIRLSIAASSSASTWLAAPAARAHDRPPRACGRRFPPSAMERAADVGLMASLVWFPFLRGEVSLTTTALGRMAASLFGTTTIWLLRPASRHSPSCSCVKYKRLKCARHGRSAVKISAR
jgi:hypothetical protein